MNRSGLHVDGAFEGLDPASEVAEFPANVHGVVVPRIVAGATAAQHGAEMVGRPSERHGEGDQRPGLTPTGVQDVHQLADGRQRDPRLRREIGHRHASLVEPDLDRVRHRGPVLIHVRSRPVEVRRA
ncbi:hypothetical protein Ae706Ps2_3563c [Pseudonocardia sp. Ae706_Ps2]|nr:hypothetical protein Ae706Ps2_3563c [Pseudonocardia sp. Ae706_Ps2]